MKRYVHPMMKRAGYAAAACVALAATGVFANYALHSDGRFNNALSRQLVTNADEMAPELNGKVQTAYDKLVVHTKNGEPAQVAAADAESLRRSKGLVTELSYSSSSLFWLQIRGIKNSNK